MTSSPYSVRIAWHSDLHSPRWELQTEHPGFRNWMEPALFANGFTEPHPWLLRLTRRRLTVALTTGGSLVLGEDASVRTDTPRVHRRGRGVGDPIDTPGLGRIQFTAWYVNAEDYFQIDQDDALVVTCGAYRELYEPTPAALSRLGLDGVWWPQSYQVMGPDGHIPVTIEADESGELITVMRDDEDPSENDADTAAIAFVMKM
jgi:hypothetical protein